LRQANSVSSICTSVIGFTSSSMTRVPTRLMSKSGETPDSEMFVYYVFKELKLTSSGHL
jgi:hypothetical protein